MKRSGFVALSLSVVLAVAAARAQDAPKPGAPAPQAPDGKKGDDAAKPDDKAPAPKPPAPDAAKPADDAKAPDPNKPVLFEPLAAGTVERKALFPLEDGRAWRYELRTWLTPTAADEGAGEAMEPPRSHRLDVRVVDPIKIEGREARCLEYKLDDEPAQKAYFFDDGGGIVLCPRRILGNGEHVHEYLFTPPQTTLQANLSVGATWDWEGKVGSASGKQKFTVLGEDRCPTKSKDLPKVGAIVIQTIVENNDDSKGVSTKWYAPGVGIVRELTEVRSDKETFRTEAVLSKITKPKE